jgi:probable HAF family extracellular repeat protein
LFIHSTAMAPKRAYDGGETVKEITRAFACILLLAAMSSVAQAASYRIVDLGGPGTEASAINIHNQTVGYSMVGNHAVAVRWDSAGMSYLTDPATTISTAMGINDQGAIVGAVRSIGTQTNSGFLLEGSTLTYLSSMYGAGDISSGGLVIGNSGFVGYFWSRATGAVQLQASGAWNTMPNCINSTGQMAGQGYLWNSPTQAVDLGFAVGQTRDARGINDRGQVVGYYISSTLGGDRSFVWDSVNGITDLGITGDAEDINNRGEVIGTDGDYHAFYWKEGELVRLASLAPGALSRAYSINDNGWIAGKAWDAQGHIHAVLWEPVPEPSSVLALLCGIGGFGGLVWRIRRREA